MVNDMYSFDIVKSHANHTSWNIPFMFHGHGVLQAKRLQLKSNRIRKESVNLNVTGFWFVLGHIMVRRWACRAGNYIMEI